MSFPATACHVHATAASNRDLREPSAGWHRGRPETDASHPFVYSHERLRSIGLINRTRSTRAAYHPRAGDHFECER